MTTTPWGARSLSFWLVILTCAGILFIGIRFLLMPAEAAKGFGIGFSSSAEAAYGYIKGIRDTFSGICLVILACMGLRRATGWVYAAAMIIPITDGLTVLKTNGPQDIAHLSIHWGTALGMLIISLLVLLPTWRPLSKPSGILSR